MTHNDDFTFLKMAIDCSRQSLAKGNFAAGAVVVRDGVVLTTNIDSHSQALHEDAKAISDAYAKYGTLTGATVYIGLESCLMCTCIGYWSGIRRVVFAIRKEKISEKYYEIPGDTSEVINSFAEKIERIHIPELEEEALSVVHEWENKYI